MFRCVLIITSTLMCFNFLWAPSNDMDRMQDFLGHIKGQATPPFEELSDYWHLKEVLPADEALLQNPDIQSYILDDLDPQGEDAHRAYAIQQVHDRHKSAFFGDLTHEAVGFIQRQKPFIDDSVRSLKARRRYIFYKTLFEKICNFDRLEIDAMSKKGQDLIKSTSDFIQSVQSERASMMASNEDSFASSVAGADESDNVGSLKVGVESAESVEHAAFSKIEDVMQVRSKNENFIVMLGQESNALDAHLRKYMRYVEEHCPKCEIAPLYYTDWLAQNI